MVGETISALTKLGHQEISFEVVTVVPTFAQRSSPAISAEDFLTEWVKDNPTFRPRDAASAFKADGRAPTSVYAALTNLVEKKVLKKLGPGNYASVDVKHLEPPKASPATRHAVSHKDFALRCARRNHGRVTASGLKDQFEKDGRNRDSVSTTINELLNAKQIKRVGEGSYVLLAAHAKTKKDKNPAREAKPEEHRSNGSAEHVEVTHG
ncbi:MULTISPECIES: hypothetical protein [unclassified Bradyrhizobium]|uniref:hypothetical protein n=1 Tax=Bradyrhizobium sp. S3.9.2 TaxID=3156432 RepID=UPI0033920295